VHGRAPRRRPGADQHLTADAGVEDLLRELAPRVLGGMVRRCEDLDHPGGASVGQPVQHHRTQGVQPDLQRQRRVPPWPPRRLGTGARGARQASAAPRWAGTSVGGMTTETGPPGRREHPPMVRSPPIARIRHHEHLNDRQYWGRVGYRRAAMAAWSRSRNGTCAAFSLRRALLSLNHSTRSISGKVSKRPDPGGHSVR
jgi:hypothetical protein